MAHKGNTQIYISLLQSIGGYDTGMIICTPNLMPHDFPRISVNALVYAKPIIYKVLICRIRPGARWSLGPFHDTVAFGAYALSAFLPLQGPLFLVHSEQIAC